MQTGLLERRDKTSNAGPDDRLIDLYASTLSSPSLVDAFRAPPKQYAKHQVEVDISTTPVTDPSATPVAKREEDIDQYANVRSDIQRLSNPRLWLCCAGGYFGETSG